MSSPSKSQKIDIDTLIGKIDKLLEESTSGLSSIEKLKLSPAQDKLCELSCIERLRLKAEQEKTEKISSAKTELDKKELMEIEKAKEIEKERVENAWLKGIESEFNDRLPSLEGAMYLYSKDNPNSDICRTEVLKLPSQKLVIPLDTMVAIRKHPIEQLSDIYQKIVSDLEWIYKYALGSDEDKENDPIPFYDFVYDIHIKELLKKENHEQQQLALEISRQCHDTWNTCGPSALKYVNNLEKDKDKRNINPYLYYYEGKYNIPRTYYYVNTEEYNKLYEGSESMFSRTLYSILSNETNRGCAYPYYNQKHIEQISPASRRDFGPTVYEIQEWNNFTFSKDPYFNWMIQQKNVITNFLNEFIKTFKFIQGQENPVYSVFPHYLIPCSSCSWGYISEGFDGEFHSNPRDGKCKINGTKDVIFYHKNKITRPSKVYGCHVSYAKGRKEALLKPIRKSDYKDLVKLGTVIVDLIELLRPDVKEYSK